MIGVIANYREHSARDLVLAALRRSVSRSMASLISPACMEQHHVLLAISPDERLGESLLNWLDAAPRKLIVFGRLPTNVMKRFHVQTLTWPEPTDSWARSPVAKANQSAQSLGVVEYLDAAKPLGGNGWTRALERFDFADEWNNLGFGAIRADGSIWALGTPVRVPADSELAHVESGSEVLTSYAALFSAGPSRVLWVNRPTGPIDSFEWRMVENYLAHYQHDTLPCVPVISEIPWGYDAAITMRLDCDEDITSARPLWQAYQELGVPLSLAIHTSNLQHDDHRDFLQDFCSSGGALLSHTATHAPNWGGSYETALAEGLESRERILAKTGVSVDYAVSPFHQSPHYALQGLSDSGYKGCIGGIIRNDPEFLMARGGELAGLSRGFIGHSQQTMLHGDCMLAEGDPMHVFKQAYNRAYETKTLFGYLDHPFSLRYQYGWTDEPQRIDAHRQFITHIRSKADNPLFMSETQALDFLSARASIQLRPESSSFICHGAHPHLGSVFGAEYRGRSEPLVVGGHLA